MIQLSVAILYTEILDVARNFYTQNLNSFILEVVIFHIYLSRITPCFISSLKLLSLIDKKKKHECLL